MCGHTSVPTFLPWSVKGQCVNNNAMCLPGGLHENVESGSVFSSLRTDELPIRKTGARVGRHSLWTGTEQTRNRQWKHLVSYPEGSWSLADGSTPTHELLPHSHTPTCKHLNHKSSARR